MERYILVDDLDGRTTEGVKKREIGVDGIIYDLDLTDPHHDQLREDLSRWLAVARPRRRPPGQRIHKGGKPTQIDKGQLDAIRTWANANGHKVSPFGRIPVKAMQDWERQHAPDAGRSLFSASS
jgi:Lsr2